MSRERTARDSGNGSGQVHATANSLTGAAGRNDYFRRYGVRDGDAPLAELALPLGIDGGIAHPACRDQPDGGHGEDGGVAGRPFDRVEGFRLAGTVGCDDGGRHGVPDFQTCDWELDGNRRVAGTGRAWGGGISS